MAGRPESPLSVGSVGLRAKRPTRSGTRGGSKSQRNPSKAKPATEAGGVSRRGIRPTEAGRAEAERRAAEGASPVIRAPRRGGAGGAAGQRKGASAAPSASPTPRSRPTTQTQGTTGRGAQRQGFRSGVEAGRRARAAAEKRAAKKKAGTKSAAKSTTKAKSATRRGGAGGSPGGKKKSYAANRNMGYRNKTPAEMKRIGRTLSRMGPSPGGGR